MGNFLLLLKKLSEFFENSPQIILSMKKYIMQNEPNKFLLLLLLLVELEFRF